LHGEIAAPLNRRGVAKEGDPLKNRFAALVFVGLLGFACSKEDQAPSRGPATPLDPATTGAIVGKVLYRGAPPPASRVQVKGDAACETEAADSPAGEDVSVRDGRVQNAFVYLKEGLGDRVFDLPRESVTIDQRGCRYIPHVVGVETGQELVFLNSDATLHNVHTQPQRSSAVNFGMGVKGAKRPVRFTKSEVMVPVKCDVHPWMRAYIGVLDHPYFFVTGADGTFRLEKVPAGSYTIEAWHERFGTRQAKVTLAEKASAEVELTFPAGD
jgi:plastocyanin